MDLAELARQTAREIAEGRAVIFLGVGASVGTESERTEGNGVVSSGELTRAIAEHFGVTLQCDGAGELVSTLRGVASRAVLERDPSTVKRFVIEKISPGCGKPLKVHRALARVAPTIVMTTNYDDLYETAMQEAGKDCERIVQSSDLVGLSLNRPRVLKLHGDKERPNEIVLTGPDYMAWRKRAAGLQAEVVAALQKHICVFVGYSVRDENLGDVLRIISENLDTDAPKHFAVVHEIDEERAAELHGSVEFVKGDATRFCELLAEESAVLSPRPRDPQRERATFEAQLETGDLVGAGQSCENLARFLIARGENAGAASLWRSFAEAAESAGEHSAAAAAFRDAGSLLWESGHALDAERALSAALRESLIAGESAIEREVYPVLQRVRLSAGRYHEVLGDTEQELRAYGDNAPPSLVYTLRAVRAEAQEIVHGIDEALGELHAALDVLPEDARYLRTKAWATVARLLADTYEWEEAHAALNTATSEVISSTGVDDVERRRCEAILKLVRANIHQSLGEDDSALRYYEECASVLEEQDEVGFAVSALQGFVDCEVYLLHDPPDRTLAHLSDLARDSQEHRRITDLERQGIAHLAEGDPVGGSLAAARDLLARAEAAAKAVHSLRSIRRVRVWYADVLQEAGLPHDALVAYVVAGDRGKAIEVAAAVRDEWPVDGNNLASLFDKLLEVASKGPIASRGPALDALKELWDLLPDETLSESADYLSKLDEFNSFIWADREVLSDAADLAYTLAPRLDDAQARNVSTAVVAAIRRDDVYFTAHKNACRALARLALTHPAILDELDVPTGRLAEMASRDVDNDRLCAMTALVNLALAGHEEAKTEALRLLEDAHPFTRVRWRQVLGIATEGELAETVREWLPRSVRRAQTAEGNTTISIGWVNPMFLSDWTLPESVKSEVALALSEAATDPTVLLHHRQAAALVLGLRAEQFEEQDVTRAVDALLEVLMCPFDAENTVLSMDNPVSMLRIYRGEADDVIAAAAESLLAFSGRLDDPTKRARILQEVGKLRVGQVEPIGVGVADGLRYFTPRSPDEESWLRIRLLLLLDSHHPIVRQGAARSLAGLVENDALSFDSEILATVLFLAEEPAVGDRAAAARVLSQMSRNSHWVRPTVENSLQTLRGDPSYLVRSRADESSQ